MSSIMPSAKTSTLVGIAAAPLLNYVSFREGDPSSLLTLRWSKRDSNRWSPWCGADPSRGSLQPGKSKNPVLKAPPRGGREPASQ